MTTTPWTWTVEPGVVVPLALASAIYAAGVARLAIEGRLPRAGASRAGAFAAGVALLVVALLSPLDAWADGLFSAHMAQHLILMMIAPPLLVAGRPAVTALWALPRAARHRVGAWWRGDSAGARVTDVVRRPLVAWLAASAALWFWHLPKPFDAAFDAPWLHAAEHLTFLASGILFWRVVLDDPQSRRLPLGATMLFVLTFAMENGMLAAILVFAPRVLYAPYVAAPAWSPLSPLEDQQLAGIAMWLVTGVIDLGVLAVLFVAWLRSGERRAALA